jgi:WD40 repeat protein
MKLLNGKTMKTNRFFISIGLGLLYFVSGCFSPSLDMEMASSTIAPQVSLTHTQTPKSTETPNRQLTKTLVASGTPLPSPTLNPNPTIPPGFEGTLLPQPSAPLALGNVAQSIELARWGKGKIQEIRYSKDGDILAILTKTGQYIYDGKSLRELPFDQEGWLSAFKPAKPNLEHQRVDNGYEIWRDGSKVGIIEFSGPFAFFSPDHTLLAISEGLLTVKLWDATTGELINAFSIPETDNDIPCGGIYSATISPDKQWLAGGCHEGAGIFVWNIASGSLKTKFPVESYFVKGLAFSPDNSEIAGVVLGGDVCIWNVTNGALSRCFTDSRVNFLVGESHLVFSPDGHALIGGFSNGEVLVWDLRAGQLLSRLHPLAPSGASIAFSSNSRWLAAAAFHDVRVWDMSNGMPVLSSNQVTPAKLASLALSPSILSGSPGDIEFVTFSPDNTSLVFGRDTSYYYWGMVGKVSSYQQVEEVNGNILAFTQDGRLITVDNPALIQKDGLIPIPQKNGPNLSVYSFSPDGRLFAEDLFGGLTVNKVRVRSVPDGKVLWTLNANYPAHIIFSPNNANLAFSTSGQVEVWQVEEKTRLYVLFLGEKQSLYALAFSPNGQIFATAGSSGVIYLWDAQTGNFLRTFEGHTDWIGDLKFSLDGVFLASASADGTVRLWGLP